MKKSYSYFTILFLLFLLFNFLIGGRNSYVTFTSSLKQLKEENIDLKRNIAAIGGAGISYSDLMSMTIEEMNIKCLKTHGYNLYKKGYPELGDPTKSDTTYITSVPGLRIIGGKIEDVKSTDFKCVDSLETFATHDGFCKVGYNKTYGFHIIIYGMVLMKDPLGKPKIRRVETQYSHLSQILVLNHQWIKKDQLIAYMGNSGRCAITVNGRCREITDYERSHGVGIHLDYLLKIDGIERNPFVNKTLNNGQPIKI